jgi:hypothetical protein
VRCSRAHIVSDLEAQGLRFRTFSIVHESTHVIADWDWNQRDLLHIPFVHGGFRLARGGVGDDVASVIYVQRVLGLRVPMTTTFHHPDPDKPRRVYSATLGPLAVVVEADLEPTAAGTLVTTVYSVGAPRAAQMLLPLAERFLRRNYARVTAEDEPLRIRRAQLREWGYRFEIDRGSYARSVDLSLRNVVAPPGPCVATRVCVGEPGRDVLVGRSDHLGLRVAAHEGGRILVYPRMCMHEGASLDTCEERGGWLRCPWHGRAVPPIAVFDSGAGGGSVRETAHHRLELLGDHIHVRPRSD